MVSETPNFSEMKGRHLNLAKRWLNKNESHGNLLEPPNMVLSKA